MDKKTKAVLAIRSCKTLEQLEVAYKYARLVLDSILTPNLTEMSMLWGLEMDEHADAKCTFENEYISKRIEIGH